ncbi:DMT family transporter [Candidatus Mcinerneyibacteriota bacterium]|nr:DMT family transporter [Candidatus Mcinerneyibacteriota bacterium]
MIPAWRSARGEVALFLSAFFFSLTALAVKAASSFFTGSFIAFFRFGVEIALCFSLLILMKKKFRVKDLRTWLLRGFFGAGSMALYFIAISLSSSGRATLLFNTYPLFVALTGALFFGKKMNRGHMASLILCGAGVWFVFHDKSDFGPAGDAAGLFSALFAGVSIHFLQRSRESDHTVIVYMAAAFFGLAFTAPSAGSAVTLSWPLVPLLIGVGLVSLAGQLLMSYGFKYIHPTRGSIIAYSSLPLTMGASFFLFDEKYHPLFFLGTLFIVAGLLVNLLNKRR